MSEDYPGIKGNLDIYGYEEDGKLCVNIHGDPEGLRSLADLLIALADADQDNVGEHWSGMQEHVHLDPDYDISESSHYTIVGRLDGAITKKFPDRFKPRTKTSYRPAT